MQYEFIEEHVKMSEVAACMNAYDNGRGEVQFVSAVPDPTEYSDGEPRCYLVLKQPVFASQENMVA